MKVEWKKGRRYSFTLGPHLVGNLLMIDVQKCMVFCTEDCVM